MKIRKKVFIGMATMLFAVATVFNMSLLNNNGAGDVSLDAIAVMAQAQNSESIPGDMTWDDYADFLNDLDEFVTGQERERVQDLNQAVCDFAHAFCDNFDISGDPVFDANNRQTDDCDGQPNFC